MTNKHSNLGASSASRWMNCPGSVNLIESLPFKPESGIYAREGTAAHQLAETCLRIDAQPYDFLGTLITIDDKEPIEITENMCDAVQVYVDYIRDRVALGGKLDIEVKFDLSSIEPGMFGTSDAAIYFDFLGEIEIVDYKHGAGVAVSPVNNSQLKYYALGATQALKVHPETKVKLTVVQPRAMGEAIKSWDCTITTLIDFSADLKAAAKLTRAEKAKTQIGDWCKFCAASAICPEIKKTALEKAQAAFGPVNELILPEPKDLKVEHIKEIMDFADTLEGWLKNVANYAFELADRGIKIPGYKLVQKRANRKWRDEEIVKQELAKLQAINYWTEPKLKSPAQIEAMKVDKNLVATLTVIPDSGLTLTTEGDKRPEAKPTKDIASIFGVIKN